MFLRTHRLNILRLVILLFVLFNIPSLGTSFAAADAPAISVAPVWHPALQLTSIIPSDIRYADASIYVTSSVPFWAVEFTCSVSATVLQAPSVGSLVNWGPDWGVSGSDSVVLDGGFNGGKITFSATRLGDKLPLGSNGVSTTLLLATLHFQVKTVAGNSPLTCVTSFLDRNGATVLTATYAAPPALTVIAGYSITGSVAFQGRTPKTGVSVSCGGLPPVASNAAGQFTVANLRQTGSYKCDFTGGILAPLSVPRAGKYLYLTGTTKVNLTGLSYNMLPVTLRGGDLNGDGTIDAADLLIITSNFYGTGIKLGDVNGDGQTNKIDLAIVGANFGYAANYRTDHVIYGLPRSVSTALDNRIWLGGLNSGPVTQLVAGTNRDFWPAVSPDGAKIAFTRLVGANHVLFVQPINGGNAVQLTPTTGTNSGYQNFAPSWSPDGSKIAFVCSDPNGWMNNVGRVCLVDPTGKNFQLLSIGTTIYPPTWLDNRTLAFGSNIPLQLTELDLGTNTLSLVDGNLPIGADMPVFRNGVLFYRFNAKIAYADLTKAVPAFGTSSLGGTNDYIRSGVGAPASAGVDYFVVSPTYDFVMYTDQTAADYSNVVNTQSCLSCIPTIWAGPTTHNVYNQFTNPSALSSTRYGERNTADLEP